MKRYLFLGTAAALLIHSHANAADPIDVTKLCTGVSANENIRPKLVGELLKKHPITVDASLLTNTELTPFQTITRSISACLTTDDSVTRCSGAKNIYRDVRALMTGSERYSNLSVFRDAEIPSKSYLSSFLDIRDPNSIRVTCKQVNPKVTGEKTKPTKLTLSKVVVGKTTADISKSLKKRDSAALSLKLDRATKLEVENEDGTSTFVDNDVVSANFVVAYPKLFNLAKSEYELDGAKTDTSLYLSPYVGLEYESNIDPEKETDNLSFGLNLKKSFGIAPLNIGKDEFGPFTISPDFSSVELDLEYITDIEERESKQWFTQARMPLLNIFPSSYWGVDRKSFQPTFDLTAVMDYSSVDERGDKAELKDKDYHRIGYDAELQMRLFEVSDWEFDYTAKYSFRETLDSSAANADYWDMGFKFKPTPESNFEYGISYKRGENLKTLEDIESWEVTIGYKQ